MFKNTLNFRPISVRINPLCLQFGAKMIRSFYPQELRHGDAIFLMPKCIFTTQATLH